jgi:hypothetical protein
VNPNKDWWLQTARDFYTADSASGGFMARTDDKQLPFAVVATNDPEVLGRMVLTVVAIYARCLREAGVEEDIIRRICQTIGEGVFKGAYSASQKLGPGG